MRSGCTNPCGFQIKSENTFAFKEFHDYLDSGAIQNYRLNHLVRGKSSLKLKKSQVSRNAWVSSVGFFSRANKMSTRRKIPKKRTTCFLCWKNSTNEIFEEDVSTIASILENEDEALVTQIPIPAPDYDEHDASVDDVLSDSEMGSYTEKNVIEHNSVDELGNHLESASIIGDLPTEVSFDSGRLDAQLNR